MRRYVGLDILTRCTPVVDGATTTDTGTEDLPAAITAA